MKRINSKSAILKKRVAVIHGRAKLAGVLYLLGIFAIAGLALLFTPFDGTILAPVTQFPTPNVPITGVIGPIMALAQNVQALTLSLLLDGVVAILYLVLAVVVIVNVFNALSKLGWLFKRKASYTNGFNRNMYAMDDLAKLFSSSFSASIILYLQIYLLTSSTVTFALPCYVWLAVGLAVHFLAGIIGGTVTLFTTGDKMEEEKREFGVFVFFIRNVIQVAIVGGILYFLVPQSVFLQGVTEIVDNVLIKNNPSWIMENVMGLLPFVFETLAWVCISVLIKHATADTEYNRDGLDGYGMKNFAVFSIFTTLLLGGIVALLFMETGFSLENEKMVALLISTGIAFGGFLLDCIIKPRHHKRYDDVDADAYFSQNNIII